MSAAATPFRRTLARAALLAVGLGLSACSGGTTTGADGFPATKSDERGRTVLTLTGLRLPAAKYQELCRHPEVQVLNIANPDVTDEQLACLEKMPDLQELDLSGSGVTDKGVGRLADLPALKVLRLRQTKVTDEGLRDLERSRSLELVDARGTAVTRDGAKRWQDSKEGRTARTDAP
jgi:hypothetical protein